MTGGKNTTSTELIRALQREIAQLCAENSTLLSNFEVAKTEIRRLHSEVGLLKKMLRPAKNHPNVECTISEELDTLIDLVAAEAEIDRLKALLGEAEK
jgi:predicted RNase H-like nuclease (RuvC/YqgF family)